MLKFVSKKKDIKFKHKSQIQTQKKGIRKKKQFGGSPDISILTELSELPFDDYGEFLNPIYGMLWNINVIPNYYKFMCNINIIGSFVKNLFTSPIFNEIVPSKTGILGKLTPFDIGEIIADYYIKKCDKENPYIDPTQPTKKKTKIIKLDAKQPPTDKDIINCSYVKPLVKLDTTIPAKESQFNREYTDFNSKFAAFKRFIDVSVTDIITNPYCFHVLMAFMWAKSENIDDIYQYLAGILESFSNLSKEKQNHYGITIIIENIHKILPRPKVSVSLGANSLVNTHKSAANSNLSVKTPAANNLSVKTPAANNQLLSNNEQIIISLVDNIKNIIGKIKIISFTESILYTELGNFQFTDCTETVIRNIINILIYYGIVSLEDLSPIFKEYFTVYNSVDKQTGNVPQYFADKMYSGRNAWAKIVSGINGIKYNEGLPNKWYNMEGDLHNLYQMLALILNINIPEGANKSKITEELVRKFLQDRNVMFEDKKDDTSTEHAIIISIHQKPEFKIRLINGHAYILYIESSRESDKADNKQKKEKLFNMISKYKKLYNLISGINGKVIPLDLFDTIPMLFYYNITTDIAIQYCNNLENYKKAKENLEFKLIYQNMFWYVLQTFDKIVKEKHTNILWLTDLLNNINLSYIPAHILEKFDIQLNDKGIISGVTINYNPSKLTIEQRANISDDMFQTLLPNTKSLTLHCETIKYISLPDTLENIIFGKEIIDNDILQLLPHSVERMQLLYKSNFSKKAIIPKNIRVLVFENYDVSVKLPEGLQKIIIVQYINKPIYIPNTVTHFSNVFNIATGEINFTNESQLTHLAYHYDPNDVVGDIVKYEYNREQFANCKNLTTIMFLNNIDIQNTGVFMFIDLDLQDSIETIIIGINNPKCNIEFINEFQTNELYAEKEYKIIITEFTTKKHLKQLKAKFSKSTFEIKPFFELINQFDN